MAYKTSGAEATKPKSMPQGRVIARPMMPMNMDCKMARRVNRLAVLGERGFQSSYLGSFPSEYVPWMALHGSLGLVPLIGATCLVVGRLMTGRNKFSTHFNQHHKAYGRTFIVVWSFTHLGGIFNAIFLR